ADVVASLAACDDDALLDQMQAAAIRMVRAGITTVRDLGDRNYLSLRLADRAAGAFLPDIVAAGPPITTSGGRRHFLGGSGRGERTRGAGLRCRQGHGERRQPHLRKPAA